jgi:hypothetical protein
MDTIKVTEASELQLGDVIANGVRVIACTKKSDRMVGIVYASWVAICAVENDPHANFVVWTVIATEDYGWVRESGDYCTSIIEAIKHYQSRGGK